jgi:hypothetical protein
MVAFLRVLTPLEDLMLGNVDEGAIPSDHVFQYLATKDLGVAAQIATTYLPVVQHGKVVTFDGLDEPGLALFIQQSPSGTADDPTGVAIDNRLRVVAFFPPAGNPLGKPVPQVTSKFPRELEKPIGTVLAAVLQGSRLHYISGFSDANGNLHLRYGRVGLAVTHVAGKPLLILTDPTNPGNPNDPAVLASQIQGVFLAFGDLTGGPTVPTFSSPTFDVTAGGLNPEAPGNPIIAYNRTFGSTLFSTISSVNVGAALFGSQASTLFQGDAVSGCATAQLAGRIDYTTSARDPLRPWQIWFVNPASQFTPNGSPPPPQLCSNDVYMLGANSQPPTLGGP